MSAAGTRALVLEGFCSRLSFGLLTFALPLYALERGLSLTAVGVLVSTASAVSLVLKPFLGALGDRVGLRRSLVVALVVRSLLCLGYLASSVPWHLFAVRAAHGASDAVRDPSVHALIAVNGGAGRMATTFAWYQTAKSVAGSLGKALAGLLLATTAGYPLTFGVAFVLSFLPVVVVTRLVPHDPPRAAASLVLRADTPATPDEDRDPPRVWAFATLGFLVAGTSGLLTSLFPVIATEYAGLSTAEAGAVYLASPVLALTGPLWGALADRVSRTLVLAVRSAANVLSAVALLLAPNLVGIALGRGLDDLGKAAFRPAWGSVMAEVSARRPDTRARTMGYLTSGEDAGDLAAPLVAGLVWSVWGVPALLLVRIVAALATELVATRLHPREHARSAPRRLRSRARARAGRG